MNDSVKALQLRRLRYLREHRQCTHPDKLTNYLLNDLQQAGLTFVDIGTSKEEIKGLRIPHLKSLAQYRLNDLRIGEGYLCSDNVQIIYRYCRQGKFSPEDIGTSKEELKSLRRNAYKVSAISVLDNLRNYHGSGWEWGEGNFYRDCQNEIMKPLQQAGLTLEDIGTSKEELASLIALQYKQFSISYLDDLLRPNEYTFNIDDRPNRFLEALKGSRLKPEDIGTSEEEIARILTPPSQVI